MENGLGEVVESNHAWLNHYEPEVPHTLDIPDLTLPHLLESTARAYPANTATIFFGERLTYSQLNEQADRFAAGLPTLGVKPNDRVAVVLPNCPQFIIAVYGALKAGAIVVPLNPASTARELHAYFVDSGASTIITGDVQAQKAGEARANSQVERLILTGSRDYLPPLMRLGVGMLGMQSRTAAVSAPLQGDRTHSFLDLIRGNEPALEEQRIGPDDTALILYTSSTTGTTGIPKGVMLSHRNLVANALQMNAWVWDAREERKDVFLGLVPLFHGFGLAAVMNLAISVAGAVLLLPRFTMRDVVRAIARFRPTIFPATPAACSAIVNYPFVQRYDLRSIRVCISSAAALPVPVTQAFESITGARLVESYGLTEASSITHCNPVHGERRAGSIGLPLPATEARVVDPDNRYLLPTGEIGDLSVRGPQVMQGYWEQEEAAGAALQDGWLYTGDMARRDEDGYFYIAARKEDVITIEGSNVYPREVEDVLYGCEKIEEVVVVGVPDRRGGEIVKAYVVLKDDVEVTEWELRTFCSERLAAHKVPARIEFREGLPRSNTGKYLRRELVWEEMERAGLQ